MKEMGREREKARANVSESVREPQQARERE